MGVGTVTMYISASLRSLGLLVRNKLFTFSKSSFSISRVVSIPCLRSLSLLLSISKPIVLILFPNSIAKGRPTYPSPTIQTLISHESIREFKFV